MRNKTLIWGPYSLGQRQQDIGTYSLLPWAATLEIEPLSVCHPPYPISSIYSNYNSPISNHYLLVIKFERKGQMLYKHRHMLESILVVLFLHC